MTELMQKQIIFSRYLALLIDEFPDTSFQLGEVYRSPEECERLAKLGLGVKNSVHNLRLAVDLRVVVDGEPSDERADYIWIAEHWKQMPLLYPETLPIVTCWGGDFLSRPDIYHFSISHNGVR